MQQAPTKVVGRRVAQFIVDLLIASVANAILWFLFTEKIPGGGPCAGGGVTINGDCRGFVQGAEGKRLAWIVLSLAVSLLVFVILPGIKGWSPGMKMLGIRLVNAEGRPPGVLRAFLRYILWIVDAFPYIIPYLTGFIVALTSARNQRVGDMVASTYVVTQEAAGIPGAITQGVVPTPYGAPQYGAPGQYGGPAQYGAPPAGAPVYASAPPQQPQQGGSQQADWYPDPQGQSRLRYWDGQRWTEHTSA
jgi:uncharacterized RDD family membrane protein YckC